MSWQTLPKPAVMAILNATPDSFSDGGLVDRDIDAAVRRAKGEGAHILDVGGESTRPGHSFVAADDEWARVEPVLAACRRIAPGLVISIDTRKASVAKRALDAGAHMVNDVSGLLDAGMAKVVAGRAAVVLMRWRDLVGEPVQACRDELASILQAAVRQGIPESDVFLDPGLGFGNPPGGNVEANLALLAGVSQYSHGRPVLIGASRKRFIGAWMQESNPSQRVTGSVRAAQMAVEAGAAIVRVHDVAATVAALR